MKTSDIKNALYIYTRKNNTTMLCSRHNNITEKEARKIASETNYHCRFVENGKEVFAK